MTKENRDALRIAVFAERDRSTPLQFNDFSSNIHGRRRNLHRCPANGRLRFARESRIIDANSRRTFFVSSYMNDNSHPAGKISLHGNGLGAPSPDEVEKRAREIALIAERDPDEFTDADWDQARRELLGVQATTPPEETPENAEVVEEWNMVASSSGHRAPRVEDEENLGEQLVSDGLEEAAHDQMVEARKEELEQEG